ncbi:MAG: NAD(+) synthase [Eubacteriales bacterium]|nr:NAD(+) synthase [Eubacteriales bacterium]
MLVDPKKTKDEIVQWIRDYFAANGPTCTAVIGISGGKDSSVAAALCAEALGKDRVLGILMPNGVQSDIEDAKQLVEAVGIPHVILNIQDGFNGMVKMIEESEDLEKITGQKGISKDARINLAPRMRMSTLYAVAQQLPNGGRVVNTCNRSEDYVGYSTKFGDAAGDFSPMSGLLVHEVLQIGAELGLPENLVKKMPSDGLSGMGDEQKLGFTYAALDHYVLTGECEDEATRAKIDRLHRLNLHKLELMPAYKLAEDAQKAI